MCNVFFYPTTLYELIQSFAVFTVLTLVGTGAGTSNAAGVFTVFRVEIIDTFFASTVAISSIIYLASISFLI